MKKFLIGFLILAFALVATFLIMQSSRTQQQQVTQQPTVIETEASREVTDFPEPPPGAIVFDMKYRSLSGGKGELRYNSYGGYGGNSKETPFLANVKKKVKDFETVYNPNFKGAEWSAVEVKGNEVVAFYFDRNADGKVSDDEKILPVQSEKTETSGYGTFVTPDVVLNTEDGRQMPFSALLEVRFDVESGHLSNTWSPSSVLEGTAIIAGKPTKLILYTDGFSGPYTQFGGSSYSLLGADELTGEDLPKQRLSSLFNYNGQYYRLKLRGTYEKDKSVQAVLEEYAGATGELAVKLTGNPGLTARRRGAALQGSNDSTIHLSISDSQSVVPAEAYKLRSVYFNYGDETGDQRGVHITEGPEFKVEAGKTCNVELGKPMLSVRAIDEKQRNQSNAREQSVFPEGTEIHLSPKITGKAGEFYRWFGKQPDISRHGEDIEPTIRIVDSKGKEVASATMEYG